MSILSDIVSKDPHKIWAACGAIRQLRDVEQLQQLANSLDLIRLSTRGVPLGGALRPNSSHLDFAIRKLDYIAKAEGCLCALYLVDDLFDPDREANAGNVRLYDEPGEKSPYCSYYSCSVCGQKFKVEAREYHYPWWEWSYIDTI